MLDKKMSFRKKPELLTEMFGYLPNLVPVVLIFVVVFLISLATNIYFTEQRAIKDGKESIRILEGYIDDKAKALLRLERKLTHKCNRADVLALREFVFESAMLKEAGLFKNGTVYCTSNAGPESIRLFSSTLDRMRESSNNTTISLSRSKSQIKTFFIYAHDGRGSGANALLPPKQFLNLVAPLLAEKKYGYRIQVLSNAIDRRSGSVEDVFSLFSFSSHLYPLSVTIYLDTAAYLHYFLENIWQTILIAGLFSVFYLLARYQTLAKRSMEFSLLSAIEDDQIDLYLQPIVDAETKKLIGSEALVRWNHPTQGQISPEIFIPLAEKLGVIDEITKRALSKVTQFIYRNKRQMEGNYVSINLSRTLVLSPEFMDYIKMYAAKHPQVVSHLLLEITENIDFNAHQMDIALKSMRDLNKLGFQIAVDDFGTGYSGLNFIRLHPFNVMKIDQVFIKALHSDSTIKPVLVSMIQLGKELGMKVIAEGVETEQQLEILQELGVKYIQGFYYSYPIKPEALIQFSHKPVVPQFSKVTLYQ